MISSDLLQIMIVFKLYSEMVNLIKIKYQINTIGYLLKKRETKKAKEEIQILI